MSARIEEVEYLGLGVLAHLVGPRGDGCPLRIDGVETVCTGSGRAALRIVLERLRAEGVLPDRNACALIPRWLCQSVTYSMGRWCHPTTMPSSSTKLVFAYHQYGFPQDMDAVTERCEELGAVLVEDCAHAIDSSYRGKRLGTFGRAAIFSFSKFFPTVLGGALASADEGILSYAEHRLAQTRWSATTYFARSQWEILRGTGLGGLAADRQEMSYAVTDSAFRMRPISFRVLHRRGVERSLERRRANYARILECLGDRPEYFEGLEREGVTPYVVPLFDTDERLERIVASLRSGGVTTGVYHFDVARNLFEPRFRKCAWLPVHQGLTGSDIERVCSLVRKA